MTDSEYPWRDESLLYELYREQEVNYPTLNAFGVLRVGLVHELGVEPFRVGVEILFLRHIIG